jgi:serine O-acetyltransferase
MPITTRRDLQLYLDADALAHGLERVTVGALVKNPSLRWQRLYRRTEYARNCWHGPLKPAAMLLQLLLLRRSVTLGFTIPPNVFGPGLCIAHWGTIVVSDKARIGANCRIHPGTSLGEKEGLAPTLGDGCNLAPGAKLIGGIVLGERCTVGANAVVTKSFPADSVLVSSETRAIDNSRELARRTSEGAA